MEKAGFRKILISSAAIIVFLAINIIVYADVVRFIPKGVFRSIFSAAGFILLLLITRYLFKRIKEDKFN